MLFYESAACLHGRRQVLRGKYYASVFTHYQPVDSNIWDFNTEVSNRNASDVTCSLYTPHHSWLTTGSGRPITK
jgi:hypothetical protein